MTHVLYCSLCGLHTRMQDRGVEGLETEVSLTVLANLAKDLRGSSVLLSADRCAALLGSPAQFSVCTVSGFSLHPPQRLFTPNRRAPLQTRSECLFTQQPPCRARPHSPVASAE